MPTRLVSFFSLPRGEQQLAVRAVAVLLAVRTILATLPFARVRRQVDRWASAPMGASDPGLVRAVRRAVDRAARSVPGSRCLAQALTAEVLLRRAGQRTRVSIGVAPDGSPLDAHAWTESGGEFVTGERDDLSRYKALLVFDDGSSPRAAR